MKLKDFRNTVIEAYNNWLNHLIKNRLLLLLVNRATLNNIIRFGESQDHFICEFTGTIEPKEGLRISASYSNKTEKVISTEDFFIKGLRTKTDSAEPSFFQSYSCLSFVDENFRHLVDQEETPLSPSVGDFGWFNLNTSGYLFLKEITLGCYINNILNFRYISTGFVFNRKLPGSEIRKILKKYLYVQDFNLTQDNHLGDNSLNWMIGKVPGLNIYGFNNLKNFALQIQSLSIEIIKEQQIDNYFENHKNLLCSLFGYTRLRGQIKLKIQNSTNYFQPDYIGQKYDGYCDIIDLKKGVIPSNSLTRSIRSKRGIIKRVRFIDYVNELIAQLHDYKDYFSNPENKAWAAKELGIKIDPESIRLIGLVGNMNNYKEAEVKKALQPFKKNIFIISYGSFIQFVNYMENKRKN